jgi:hypothetical protein
MGLWCCAAMPVISHILKQNRLIKFYLLLVVQGLIRIIERQIAM